MRIHILPRRALVTAAAGALLALAIGGVPSLGQAEGDSAAGAMGYEELTLGAGDYAFDWPETIEAGRMVITMENTGREPHHAQLVRLREGVTLDDARAALPHLEEDPAAMLSLVTLQGGPGIIVPGATQRLILDLKPGTYVWVCGIPAADGEPHFAKGMLAPFEVVPDGTEAAAEPEADGRLALQDFAFALPEPIGAGRQLWEVVNEGHQPHEFLLAQLAPGATALDFAMAAFDPAAEGPPPGMPVGGLQAVEPGTTAWLELDLAPGTYGAVCFIPDPASGEPHIALGMVAEFTVGEEAA